MFSGSGYVDWKRVMTIALSGKNKLAFVDGSLPRPTSNATGKAWDRVNNVVMGWIIAVLEDSIAKSVLSYKTAKDIWFGLAERYGQSTNTQLFSIQEELNNLFQTPNMSIAEFFTKIKTLWDELDNLNPLPTCSCAANNSCTCELPKKCFKMQQNTRVISFLMKLNKRYSQVRSNMLMMPDLPTSAQAYKFLLQEEKHLDLSANLNEATESLACRAEKRKFQEKGYAKNESRNKRQNYYCDHYKISGHTKEKCWKIVGYPPNFKGHTWKRDTKSNAHNAFHSEDSEESVTAKFTNSQYQQILDLLNKQDSKGINATVHTTQLTGNISHPFLDLESDSWIIDSGASDHMCHDLRRFTTYKYVSDTNHMVTVPDGRRMKVHTIGNFNLPNGIKLMNVLHVPQFKFNLISVQKLTSHTN